MSFNKKKQKQSSVYPLFQPLQLRASTEPPPRNDEDSDDDEEDWDIPLTSLMTKHPNNAKGNNDTNAKTEKREETVKTKKRPPTTATTTKRQTSKKSKSSSSSLEGTSFTTARAMLNQTKLSSVLSRKQKEETRESQPTVTMQSSASGSVISSLSTTTSTSTDTNKQNATNKPLPRPRNPEPLQPESSSQENENNSTVNNNKTPGQQKFQQRQDLPQDKNDIPMCLDDEPEQEETKQPPDPLTEPISKTNRRPRRIFSDSSSEIPFSPPAEKSFHILSQLLERTRLGGQTFTTKNFNAPQWKIPSWVALEAPPSKLLCMSWDSMGVLLAVAFADQMIRVYDWDMVRAADLQGRRDRTRQNKTTLYKLPPILQFQTPTVVSTIVWNRYDLDQLAVGFRHTGQVHLYNVEKISTWISKNHARNNARSWKPPKSTYGILHYPRSQGSVLGCHFANEDTLLVNLGKILYCWKNIQNALATTLAWRYQPSAKVTSISPVLLHHPKSSSNDLIVLGTDHGQLIVLNFQKITKERAFSSQHRPIVLQEWTPHRKSPAGGSRILQLYARATSSTRNSKNNHTALGRVEFSWVTAQGWLLSTNLSVLPNTTSGNRAATTDTVVHTPPRVEVYNADGERIEVSGQHKTYSSPKDPVVAYHCNNNGWYFSHVPQTTKILPHHNKYVLQSNITDIQTSSSEKSKALLFWNNSKVQKMKLPSGINHTPSVVAVHPDGEWMALGVNHRLVVMTVARR